MGRGRAGRFGFGVGILTLDWDGRETVSRSRRDFEFFGPSRCQMSVRRAVTCAEHFTCAYVHLRTDSVDARSPD